MTDKIESGVEYVMSKPEPNLSRRDRKNSRKRSDKILNSLIALVAALIVIVASMIFWGNDDKNEADGDKDKIVDTENDAEKENDLELDNDSATSDKGNEPDTDEANDSGNMDEPAQNQNERSDQEGSNEGNTPDDSGIETIERTEEDVVAETIVNTTWQAIGTEQIGEHISSYDGKSIDWIEKKKAIAYAIGYPVDSLNYKKVKNGGSPQKSIGIVDVKGSAEKYRVYIEWIDGQGWKPVKVDILTTLDFDY